MADDVKVINQRPWRSAANQSKLYLSRWTTGLTPYKATSLLLVSQAEELLQYMLMCEMKILISTDLRMVVIID